MTTRYDLLSNDQLVRTPKLPNDETTQVLRHNEIPTVRNSEKEHRQITITTGTRTETHAPKVDRNQTLNIRMYENKPQPVCQSL